MQSKRSYFDLGVFQKTVMRFWPIAIGYFAIWALIMPLTFVNQYDYHDAALDIVEFIPQGSVIMSACFSCISALAVFSYLFNLRSSVMYHSLPVSREGMFCSNYAAGLSFMIVPNLLIYLLTLLVVLFNRGMNGEVFKAASIWLCTTSMMCLFFYSFAVLLCMIVGTWFMMPVLYGILNFTAVVIESIVHAALDVLIYGYGVGQTVMTVFSPVVYMMSEFRFYKWQDNVRCLIVEDYIWTYLGILTLLAAAMILIALCLYKTRNMETAGDIITVKSLRPVFKYCFASGCAIVIGAFIYGIMGFETGLAMYVFALIGGAIGYLVATMALRKSFRVKMSAVKGFAVFAAVVTVLFCTVVFDLFGIEKYVPNASRVENAIISVEGDQLSVSEGDISLAELMSIHRKIVAQKRDDEHVRNTMYRADIVTSYNSRYVISVNITYWTPLRTIKRHYTLPVTDPLLADPTSAQSMMRDKVNEVDFLIKKYSWAFNDLAPYQVNLNMYGVSEYEEKFGIEYETKEDAIAANKTEITDWEINFAEPDVRITRLLNAFKSDVLSGNYNGFERGKDAVGSVNFYYMVEEPYLDYSGHTQINYAKRNHYTQIYEGTELYRLAMEYLLDANKPKE